MPNAIVRVKEYSIIFKFICGVSDQLSKLIRDNDESETILITPSGLTIVKIIVLKINDDIIMLKVYINGNLSGVKSCFRWTLSKSAVTHVVVQSFCELPIELSKNEIICL
jgi:hypothetical protein